MDEGGGDGAVATGVPEQYGGGGGRLSRATAQRALNRLLDFIGFTKNRVWLSKLVKQFFDVVGHL